MRKQLIHTTPGEYETQTVDGEETQVEITAPVIHIEIDEAETDEPRYNDLRARMLRREAQKRGDGWSYREVDD